MLAVADAATGAFGKLRSDPTPMLRKREELLSAQRPEWVNLIAKQQWSDASSRWFAD
jgi:hypothetical protein